MDLLKTIAIGVASGVVGGFVMSNYRDGFDLEKQKRNLAAYRLVLVNPMAAVTLAPAVAGGALGSLVLYYMGDYSTMAMIGAGAVGGMAGNVVFVRVFAELMRQVRF